MTLGQRIQTLRKQQGLSQEQLGEALGVSRQAVSRWEMDGAVPEVDKLITMSRLFGVDLNDLLQVERTAPLQEEKSAPRKSMHRRMSVAAGVLCAVLLLSNLLLWVQVVQLKKLFEPWGQLREYAQEQLDDLTRPQPEEFRPQLLNLSHTGVIVEENEGSSPEICFGVFFHLPEDLDMEGITVTLEASTPLLAEPIQRPIECSGDGLWQGRFDLIWHSKLPLDAQVTIRFSGEGIKTTSVYIYQLLYYPSTGLTKTLLTYQPDI